VLGPGARVEIVGGETRTAGAAQFGNGDVLVGSAHASARVTCGGRLSEGSTADGRPAPGIADVMMFDSTRLKRREGSAFDLLEGQVTLTTGPVTSRIVVFHGTAFLEVPTTNRDGVHVALSTDGAALKVLVEKGDVLLHSTGATEKELHFVRLGAGEAATATPGEKPRKLEPAQDD